jgi:hypothetical protein
MGSYYDTMQVCKRWGHIVTDMYDSYPNHRQNYCEKCGSTTVFKCSHCNTKIRGYYHVEGVIGGGGPDVPLNCHFCGKLYPWKRKVLIKKCLTALISPIKYVVDGVIGIFKK